MVLGSITGAALGGLLLGVIPDLVLVPALAVVLLASAVKLARHDQNAVDRSSSTR
jgi:uncharacterized protein